MEKKIFEEMRKLFESYVNDYKAVENKGDRNIILKEAHTYRVVKEMEAIALSLELSENDIQLAKTAALFHDIGRFEQYKRYRTFRDSESVNHAEFGVSILKSSDFLSGLNEHDKNLILFAISNHNLFTLPEIKEDRRLLFARMLRDADKLDIWRVVIQNYTADGEKRNEVVSMGIPETAGFSERVLQSIMERRLVDLRDVKNLNDLRLLQVGWVFDLNYPYSFKVVKERGYMDFLEGFLPNDKEIQTAFSKVRQFIDSKLD